MGQEGLFDDVGDGGRRPARLGQDVMGLGESRDAGGKGGEPVLDARRPAQGLVGDRRDHGEGVLHPVLQFAGQELLAALGELFLRNVANRADEAYRLAIFDDGLAAGMDVAERPILDPDGAIGDVVVARRSRIDRRGDRVLDPGPILRMERRQEDVVIGDRLAGRDPEHGAAAIVPDEDAGSQIIVEGPDLRRFLGEPQARLGLLQRDLGPATARIGPGARQDLANEGDVLVGPAPEARGMDIEDELRLAALDDGDVDEGADREPGPILGGIQGLARLEDVLHDEKALAQGRKEVFPINADLVSPPKRRRPLFAPFVDDGRVTAASVDRRVADPRDPERLAEDRQSEAGIIRRPGFAHHVVAQLQKGGLAAIALLLGGDVDDSPGKALRAAGGVVEAAASGEDPADLSMGGRAAELLGEDVRARHRRFELCADAGPIFGMNAVEKGGDGHTLPGGRLADAEDRRKALIGKEDIGRDVPIEGADDRRGIQRQAQPFATRVEFLALQDLLGAVAQDLQKAGRLLVVVEKRHHLAAGEEARPVGPQMPALVACLSFRERQTHLALMDAVRHVLAREDRLDRPADHLLGAPAERRFSGLVPGGDGAVEIGGDDGIVDRALDDQPIAGLGAVEGTAQIGDFAIMVRDLGPFVFGKLKTGETKAQILVFALKSGQAPLSREMEYLGFAHPSVRDSAFSRRRRWGRRYALRPLLESRSGRLLPAKSKTPQYLRALQSRRCERGTGERAASPASRRRDDATVRPRRRNHRWKSGAGPFRRSERPCRRCGRARR